MALVRNLERLAVVIGALLLCTATCSASPADDEKSLGRQYSSQLEKQVKLSTDEEAQSRVERVGQSIAAVANTLEVPASYGTSQVLKFKYRFKVVEDESVNAVSLPGGYIYVNTGLLKLVDSNDELAGVLAHEVAHSAHRHATHLIGRSASVDRCVALAAIAGILSGARPSDLANILAGAKMLRTGKLSGYTQEAENDADRTAVAYLHHAGYKPSAYLEFMRKLAQRHASDPGLSLGIFQTHPAYAARESSIVSAMKDLGLTAGLRELLGGVRVQVEQIPNSDDLHRVRVCDRILYEPASVQGIGSSKERAELIAGTLKNVFATTPQKRIITCDEVSGQVSLEGQHVLTVLEADAALKGCSPEELLQDVKHALEYAAWAEWLACETNPNL